MEKKSVRVGPGQITQIGLNKEQIQKVKEKWEADNHKAEEKPTDAYYLAAEDRAPLLLIYSLFVEKAESGKAPEPIWNGETVYAIGLGFPLSTNETPGKCVQYIYNPVAARSFLGLDENMMDESEEEDD